MISSIKSLMPEMHQTISRLVARRQELIRRIYKCGHGSLQWFWEIEIGDGYPSPISMQFMCLPVSVTAAALLAEAVAAINWTITTWPEPARGGGPGAKLRYEANQPLEKLNRREHELGAAVGREPG